MKKVLLVLLVGLLSTTVAMAAGLQVGVKCPEFSLKDSAGNTYSLETPPYAGKVVAIFYTDKASSDKNPQVEQRLKAAKFDPKTYKSMVILNLKDTPLPNFILKKIIMKRQEELKSPILVDENHILVNAWGLNEKAYNVVLVDKGRVVRYIFRGAERAVMPPVEVDKLIALIREYHAK